MMNEEMVRIQRREPVVNQVHQALRKAVLQRQFQPGERLVETELAVMLGVSRTPVREALSKLEVEGLVESLPAGGVAVRDIEAELAEIYGLRQRIEGYAAYLAAQRVSDDELSTIAESQQIVLAAIDNPSLQARADLNNAFHRLLIEASHSPRLIRLSNDYRDYFLNQRILQFYDRETSLRHIRQHDAIVDALRARDSEQAEERVREHFRSALTVIQTSLERERHDLSLKGTDMDAEGL
jgi:DNA-binding GntR family transcriptional regulator